MGACSLACGSGSVGERPALWKESLRCWTRAWADGSLVASQVESLCAFVVNQEELLCGGSGFDVGLGAAEVVDFWLEKVEVVVCREAELGLRGAWEIVRGSSGAMILTTCCGVLAVHLSRGLEDSRGCRVLSLSWGSGGYPLTRSLRVSGRCWTCVEGQRPRRAWEGAAPRQNDGAVVHYSAIFPMARGPMQ